MMNLLKKYLSQQTQNAKKISDEQLAFVWKIDNICDTKCKLK